MDIEGPQGDILMGDRACTLAVRRPAPCTLFWPVTVYDAETRSQEQVARRSLFEPAVQRLSSGRLR